MNILSGNVAARASAAIRGAQSKSLTRPNTAPRGPRVGDVYRYRSTGDFYIVTRVERDHVVLGREPIPGTIYSVRCPLDLSKHERARWSDAYGQGKARTKPPLPGLCFSGLFDAVH